MQGWLLALYPKQWRDQYGAEYLALLEDTELSPAVVLDIVKAACLARLQIHERMLVSSVAIALYTLSGCICLRLGLTDNWPLWAPTNPARAAGLAITLIPLLYMGHMWLQPIYQRMRVRHDRKSATLRFLAALPISSAAIVLT